MDSDDNDDEDVGEQEEKLKMCPYSISRNKCCLPLFLWTRLVVDSVRKNIFGINLNNFLCVFLFFPLGFRRKKK